jgi:hypothetical protein
MLPLKRIAFVTGSTGLPGNNLVRELTGIAIMDFCLAHRRLFLG